MANPANGWCNAVRKGLHTCRNLSARVKCMNGNRRKHGSTFRSDMVSAFNDGLDASAASRIKGFAFRTRAQRTWQTCSEICKPFGSEARGLYGNGGGRLQGACASAAGVRLRFGTAAEIDRRFGG